MTKRFFLVVTLTVFLLSSCSDHSDNYWNKKFPPDKLKADLKYMYDILKQEHPRPYEFTQKKELEALFDSLYSNITSEMNENEFIYFVTPLITKVHCAHTWIDSSPTWKPNSSKNYICPPFKLFYEDGKAYIRLNFSENKELSPGTEVISINEIPISEIINNYLSRITSEGIHESAQYWIMNYIHTSLFRGYRDYYKTKNYRIKIITAEKKQRVIDVQAIKYENYEKLIQKNTIDRKYQLTYLKGDSLAYLDFPSFAFPTDIKSETFFSSTFKSLKEKGTKNLIIDLRGNAGGPGEIAGDFLQYLMRDTFTYYNPNRSGKGHSDLKKPMAVLDNRYNGNLYFLIDGGCYSTCGHFLSMVKYYKLGKIIGEKSSSGFSCNSNGVPYRLPNTEIDFFCSSKIVETNVHGFNRADGISPDYEVKTTLQDIIYRKDPVFGYAMKLAMTNKKIADTAN